MLVAVPKESAPGETRAALIPANLSALKKAGLEVAVEAGLGVASGHSDDEYETQGARVEPDRTKLLQQADIVALVNGALPEQDVAAMRAGTAVIAFLEPFDDPRRMQALAQRGLTLFSMELMPRITRAQSMDALSSMASIAGYRAALIGAQACPKMFPMMMTAAGTIQPARVFVIGAGVAGLQAIATAKRLGAVVEGYDIRSAVKEQIESLGAKFFELKVDVETKQGEGGYAAAQSKEFYERQQQLLGEHLATVDVILTTAAVPGRKAPILITEAMVRGLKPGTVVVDLAAERGGNCALTQAGETVDYRGIKIIGPVNLAATTPVHASQMYAKNVTTFLSHLVKEGKLTIDREDEITAGTLVGVDGQIVHPKLVEILTPPAPDEPGEAKGA